MASPPLNLARLLLFVAFFPIVLANGVPLKGMGDGGGVGMENEELLGLFEVVGALLEDSTWAQLHPHPCTDTPWPGIQCEMIQSPSPQQQQQQDPFLHVTKLHIGPDVASPPCKSTAKLSKSLLKLPFLKTLSLFSCFLTPSTLVSLSPSLFTNGSSLEQLVFKSNPGLSGEIPSSIANLGKLRVLSLSQNNLHGEIPKELGGLMRLEQMDLSYNNLTGQIPDEIGGLTSLTIFDLSWNGLEGQVPRSVGQLQSLQKVDLSSNKLSGKIPSEMGNLESLVLFDLSQNSLSGPIPETLSGLKELEYFLIENNPINSGLPLFIGALRKLAVLSLSGCVFTGSIPTYFGSLCNLTALSLDRNRLNGTIPPSLGTLPNLGQLNLSQNQLSGEIAFSEEFVSRLGKRLDIRDNKGLCTSSHMHQNLSLHLDAPPCMDSLPKSGNRSWAEEPGVDSDDMRLKPSWYDGKGSSSGLVGSERLISFWCLGLSIFVI